MVLFPKRGATALDRTTHRLRQRGRANYIVEVFLDSPTGQARLAGRERVKQMTRNVAIFSDAVTNCATVYVTDTM